MSTLIISVLISIGFAYFATQNTGGVTINLLNYTFRDMPLYLVVLDSLLFGLIVSWFISGVDSLITLVTIKHQESKLKQSFKSQEELKQHMSDLEIENARLKAKEEERAAATLEFEQPYEVVRQEAPKRSLFDRIRHNLSV